MRLLMHSTIYSHMASMGDASRPMPAIQDMRAPRVCYHLKPTGGHVQRLLRSRARGIDDGVPAMGPDEGPGSKTRAEAAVWGHGEPRARKTALGREELLYKNPAWVD